MTTWRIFEHRRVQVRAVAGDRCGYCLTHQRYAMQVLEIEHIIPKAKGGTDDDGNLWLACRLCNNAKGVQTHGYDPFTERRVRLFNPRTQQWRRHFSWDSEGVHVQGRMACGRVTVAALRLNNDIAIMVRRNWVLAGWHPPHA